MVFGPSPPQYDAMQQSNAAALVESENQEADMSTEYRFRRRTKWDETRRSERMRFVGSAIGLWAVCATGIYLIGPAERELNAPAVMPVHAMAERAHATIAAYQP
jgi:hypothetical protein